jgi:hypothetical protein
VLEYLLSETLKNKYARYITNQNRYTHRKGKIQHVKETYTRPMRSKQTKVTSITCKIFYKHFTLLVKCKIQHSNNGAAVFIYKLTHLMMAMYADTCAVQQRKKLRDSRVRIPYVGFTVSNGMFTKWLLVFWFREKSHKLIKINNNNNNDDLLNYCHRVVFF